MSDDNTHVAELTVQTITTVSSNPNTNSTSNSNSKSKPKLSLFRRIFDPEYPGAMDGTQRREHVRERPRERPPPETQVVYGYWEPARVAANKTVELKRKIPHHAKTMGNLRGAAKSQSQVYGDTASQVGSMTSHSHSNSRSNSQANTTSQTQSDFSAAAVETSSLLNPRTRKTRAGSDAGMTSLSENGTAVHPNPLVQRQHEHRSKKSTASSASSLKTSPNPSPAVVNPRPTLPNFSPAVSGTTAPPTFELTPLSGLIKQSFKDIESLKQAHKTRVGAGEGVISTDHKGRMIDFDKVEDNLRRFEEFYRSFLRYGGAHGDKNEEVHLVAMVCKRSELINGTVASGEAVPLARVPDCGY